MNDRDLIGELLTSLELAEVRLMEWGFLNVAHTVEEVAHLFAGHPTLGGKYLAAREEIGDDLWIDNLSSLGLLYRVSFGPPATYRSRFAESMRLFLALRQRFTRDDWSSAPELVSDARYFLGPRRFPVRDVSLDGAWNALSRVVWSANLQRKVLSALIRRKDGAEIMLAPFQVRATRRILEHYANPVRASGTVITAGTGGGKTKSFYIPAFMGIVADIAQDPKAVTRVLGIYPRNVLLADQFAEAARSAVQVNAAVGGDIRRPVRIGALIGDVPLTHDFESDGRNRYQLHAWPRLPRIAARRVPHLRDPDTGKPLIWLDADRTAGSTALRLEEDPDRVVIPDGMVALTRESMMSDPPDILLTSIEMINKELSSELGRKILNFGTGAPHLKLVLLDEIHTYEGLTGAQVPWILRRLSYWTRGPSRSVTAHVVGLSATLQDASDHLSTLSGIAQASIAEIGPDQSLGELTIEGQEYNVALKSHPGSGAGVLATSIQTVMLGARVLTPRGHASDSAEIGARYFFGQKVFGFTDNLDVVNRWLPDYFDAERIRKLPSLRKPRHGDDAELRAGQSWRLSEQLRHNLDVPLGVTRTSSQDPGVDASADVVLATSALEVGFDDDQVGMVVQHKAPRSAASFLQRKGRAGRRKGMRPWALVVLSDHGRDRWAFRDSERLFSPSLDRLSLPVFNPYVLRIQATWFLVDWIARRVGRGIPSLYLARHKHFDARAMQTVERLVEKPEVRDQLTRDMADWLRYAQGGVRVVDADALAHDLLWNPPRAVLRNVVPVLWNQLQRAGRSPTEKRLLPQFLPERTWEVLDTQDVTLMMPNGLSNTLDVRRALRECPPGRVSRRFAVDRKEPSKWLAWSTALQSHPAPVSVSAADLADRYLVQNGLSDVTIYQPTELVIGDVPAAVKKSSNADWKWECFVRSEGSAATLSLASGAAAKAIFASAEGWLHREHSWLDVYRFARSVRYELLLQQGETRRGSVHITHPADLKSARDAAIGFVRSVDGVKMEIRAQLLGRTPDLPAEVVAALRPSFFRHLAMASDVLRQSTSAFGVGLLVTSALGMTVATALRQRISTEQAWAALTDKPKAAQKVLKAILAGETASGNDSEESSPSRGIDEAVRLWSDPAVAAEMDRLAPSMWSSGGERWQKWLRSVLLETVRSAVEVAVQSVLPEVPESDFSVDAVCESSGACIWILETEPGGIGVVDRLLAETARDPDLFDTALEISLIRCHAEHVTSNALDAVTAALSSDAHLADAFAAVRSATAYCELEAARDDLVQALANSGLNYSREAVTVIAGKALMAGSDRNTDRWLRGLHASRRAASRKLGVGIDPRIWAYHVASMAKYRDLMANTLRRQQDTEPTNAQIIASLVRLTLDPCRDSCPECLGTRHEMAGIVSSRRVAACWLPLQSAEAVVDVRSNSNWKEDVVQALQSSSRIKIRFEDAARLEVGAFLIARLAVRNDRGYALSGFRVAATTRSGSVWESLLRVDDTETV